MAALLPWVSENWFLLLQSLGIVAGLFFTAITVRQATKARQIHDLLNLNEQHRELWLELHQDEGLARILRKEVDLVAKSISPAEERFLNLVIVHFNMGWQLARHDALIPLKALEVDVRSFFNLPLPRKVWEQTKTLRETGFTRFVENCLK